MRTLVATLTLLFFVAGHAWAQEQERTLQERIERPNMELENTQFQKAYQSSSKSDAASTTAAVRDFQFEDRVRATAFSTKEFAGSGTYWTGDFQVQGKKELKDARRVIDGATTEYQTGEFDSKSATIAEKKAETATYTAGDRVFHGRESEHMVTPIDPADQPKGWTGSMEKMSIDDIRNLLNKK